jgi:hypothetical protein
MRTIYSTRDISIPDGGKHGQKLCGNAKLSEHDGEKKKDTDSENTPLTLLFL